VAAPIYCPKCEAGNHPDADVCGQYGHAFIEPEHRTRATKKRFNSFRAFAAIALVAFIVTVVALSLRMVEPRKGAADLVLMLIYYLVVIAAIGGFVAIPGIVASSRDHPNAGAIWAVAILFGWTFLGWGIALVWALTNPPHRKRPGYRRH
jgi:hypothetical protein